MTERFKWLLAAVLLSAALSYGQQAEPVQPLPEPLTLRSSWLSALNQRLETKQFRADAVTMRQLSTLLRAVNSRGVLPAGKLVVLMAGKTYEYDAPTHQLKPHEPLPSWPAGPGAPLKLAFLPSHGMSREQVWLWQGWAMQAVGVTAWPAGLSVRLLGDWALAVGKPDEVPVFVPAKEPSGYHSWSELFSRPLQRALSRLNEDEAPAGELTSDLELGLAWAAYGTSAVTVEGHRPRRMVLSQWQSFPLKLYRWDKQSAAAYEPLKGRWQSLKQGGRLKAEIEKALKENISDRGWLVSWDRGAAKKSETAWWQWGTALFNVMVSAAQLDLKPEFMPLPADPALLPDQSENETPLALLMLAHREASVQGGMKTGDFQGESLQWPLIRVWIEISDGRLTDIEVVENESDGAYVDAVLDRLPDDMMKRNDWNVDAVTGATLTSSSLKQAVKAAMKAARHAE